jgi:hypothetical protein
MNQTPNPILNLSVPYQTPQPHEYKSWEQFRQILEQQAEIIRAFQGQVGRCTCHIIDPSKMRILL